MAINLLLSVGEAALLGSIDNIDVLHVRNSYSQYEL